MVQIKVPENVAITNIDIAILSEISTPLYAHKCFNMCRLAKTNNFQLTHPADKNTLEHTPPVISI